MIADFPDPRGHPQLSTQEMKSAVELLLRRDVDESQKARFLTDLEVRGETAEELAGFAAILLDAGVRPEIPRDLPLVELCGTGGDKAGLLNISTAAMFIVAGAGVRVVKHGNRAVSSQCGSADVLEALGVCLHLKPDSIATVLEKAGNVFLLASDFHPAVAAVGSLRRSLASQGQRTIFNLLGPLLNPASPDFQLTGVYSPELLDLYASALGLLGRSHAWAVHGMGSSADGGFDELSILGPSSVAAFTSGQIDRFEIDPTALGFSDQHVISSLIGGNAAENAARIREILSGRDHGAARDMILLNAGAAIHITGRTKTLGEGIDLACESLDSGGAIRALNRLREASSEAAR